MFENLINFLIDHRKKWKIIYWVFFVISCLFMLHSNGFLFLISIIVFIGISILEVFLRIKIINNSNQNDQL